MVKTVIRVRNFNSSINFYNNILRFSIKETWTDTGAKGCILQIDNNSYIEIQEINTENSSYISSYSENVQGNKIELQIQVEDIGYWKDLLTHSKWPFRGPDDKTWGSKYLYVNDPDGLSIVFYQEIS